MTALISFENVTVCYGRHAALQDVSGAFQAGSLTAIAGPNGAGKSTLLKAVLGLVKPSAGKIAVQGNPKTAYLPQSAAVRRDFPFSVMQAACTGLWPTLGGRKSINAAAQARVMQVLAEVGLNGLEDRAVEDLSGGQFQRLLFARVMLQDAALILLDEPFAAVDAATTARLIQIILNWHREGRAVICVLHDLLLIQKYFPDSFVLAGKCLGHGHTHKLLEQDLLSFDLDMAELCPGPETEAHHKHEIKAARIPATHDAAAHEGCNHEHH